MGYSIATRVLNPHLQEQMYVFFRREYRDWSQLHGSPEPTPNALSELSKGLDYDHSKLALGFDYKSWLHGWPRVYAYSLMHWITLKVGKRRRRFKILKPDFPEPVPYFVYDGYEPTPVLSVSDESKVASLPESHRCWAVDELGCYFPTDQSSVHAGFTGLDESEMDAYKVATSKMTVTAESDWDRWRVEHHQVLVEVTKAKVARGILTVRTELKRLDDLWLSV